MNVKSELNASVSLKKAVSFPCPTCGRKLTRQLRHRKLSIEYKCPSCDRVGP